MEGLKQLFKSWCGTEADTVNALSQSGSNRCYYRLSAEGASVIGVVGTDRDENRAFITEARHFRAKGIRVPEVLAESGDGMRYLQEDLGDCILFDLVRGGRESGEYSEEERALLRKAVAGLPKIQFEGAERLDFDVCYPDREFNARMVDFDLNYFKYCFLKTSGIEFNEVRLQDDFDRLKEDLLGCGGITFMYRDFQARNVMVRDGEPWYIDFQGGRKGPFLYDVASFIWQARSRFPKELKRELADTYLEALAPYVAIDRDAFMRRLRLFVLFRTLQVLGAYGFRGRFEKKRHFIMSIPAAIDGLRELLEEPFTAYPYLNEVLTSLAETGVPAARPGNGTLEVTVWSFSFKKGIPEDSSGNGGGYVFDCRGIPNPGRYEQYRHSTGMDADVIAFLEGRDEVYRFLDRAYGLVDSHVEEFLERGFSHIQVCFGCTGGQHRSVYSAENMARHLHEKYDIKVRLIHREQGVDRILQ